MRLFIKYELVAFLGNAFLRFCKKKIKGWQLVIIQLEKYRFY